MFCDNCGKQIRSAAKFCSFCGHKVEDQPGRTEVIEDPFNMEDVRNSRVIKSYGGGSSTDSFLIFQLVLLVALILLGIVFMTNESMNRPIFRSLSSSQEDIFRVLIWCLITIDGIIFIIKALKLGAIKSTQLCITRSGIYGKAAKENYLSVEEFTICFSELHQVSVNSGVLEILSSQGKYKLLLDGAENAADSIREMKYGTVRGMFPNQTNVPQNSWICPDCGKINYNYVGTCGCGHSRPYLR